MSINPSETLKHFFAIEKAQIKKDIIRAEGNLKLIIDEAKELRSDDVLIRSADKQAKAYHFGMIQAVELCRLSHVVPEYEIFYASFGAGQVMQDAEMEAHNKGTLSELSNEMDVIRKREGLTSDQFWYRGNGPEDYELLESEYDKVLEKISDTVFTHTLERYGLGDVADLFENDRTEFEFQREIGRRAIHSDEDSNKYISQRMDDMTRKEFGDRVFERIIRRVDELKKGKS